MSQNTNSIRKMISLMVQEELQLQLPRLIRETLSERYLRSLMLSESGHNNKKKTVPHNKNPDSLESAYGFEDEAPQIVPSDHQGIYAKNDLQKNERIHNNGNQERRKVMVEKFLGPMGSYLEDNVNLDQPLPQVTNPYASANPLNELRQAGLNVGAMQQMFATMNKKEPKAEERRELLENKEKELAMRRKRLESLKIGE